MDFELRYAAVNPEGEIDLKSLRENFTYFGDFDVRRDVGALAVGKSNISLCVDNKNGFRFKRKTSAEFEAKEFINGLQHSERNGSIEEIETWFLDRRSLHLEWMLSCYVIYSVEMDAFVTVGNQKAKTLRRAAKYPPCGWEGMEHIYKAKGVHMVPFSKAYLLEVAEKRPDAKHENVNIQPEDPFLPRKEYLVSKNRELVAKVIGVIGKGHRDDVAQLLEVNKWLFYRWMTENKRMPMLIRLRLMNLANLDKVDDFGELYYPRDFLQEQFAKDKERLDQLSQSGMASVDDGGERLYFGGLLTKKVMNKVSFYFNIKYPRDVSDLAGYAQSISEITRFEFLSKDGLGKKNAEIVERFLAKYGKTFKAENSEVVS